MYSRGSTQPRLKEQDRSSLISSLVTSTLKQTEISDDSRQACQARMFSFAIRILGSSLTSASSPDASSIILGLKTRLQQEHKDGAAKSLEDKYNKLASTKALSNTTLASVLCLLQQISQGPQSPQLASIASYQPLQVPKARAVSQQDTYPATQSDQHTRSLGQAAPRPLPASNATRQERSQARAAAAGSSAAEDRQHAGAVTVKEPALVKDVLRAAQALSGALCKLSQPDDPWKAQLHVAPYPEASMHCAERSIMHALAELGVMYRTVLHHAEAGKSRGAVRQALSAALQKELTDLYRLMAILEAQLAHPLPLPDSSPEAAAGSYLTLRRLVLWLAEPLRRMRLLAVLADGTSGHDGGTLAGLVWAHTKCGDPSSRAYCTKVLHQVCVPLFDMIRRWVFEGCLEDAHCEFFVVAQPPLPPASSSTSGSSRRPRGPDPWKDIYRIEHAKLPPFVGKELADRILRAGKSINFLRDSCGDVEWVHDWAAAAQDAAAAVGYGQLPALEALVARASAQVDARLMKVLYSRHHLDRHCDAIRRYLLLGQGDWVVALLDALGPELSKPAKEVSEVLLNHLLHAAIQGSAARADDEDTLARLHARKDIAAGAQETGWDVFALHYEVGAPLCSFFTASAMESYSRVSKLLWRLRRSERALCMSWRTLKVEIERELPKFRAATRGRLEELLRDCLRVRAEMSHFATNLQYYLTFEVLGGAWEQFQSRAAAAGDLDALLSAHETYLAQLLKQGLLEEEAGQLRETLNSLLANMLRLSPLVGRFNEQVRMALLWMEKQARVAAANTAAGRWGNTSEDNSLRLEEEVEFHELGEVGNTLKDLEDQHQQGIRQFTQLLPAQVHHDVRFLLCRLDFTEFYNRRSSDAGLA